MFSQCNFFEEIDYHCVLYWESVLLLKVTHKDNSSRIWHFTFAGLFLIALKNDKGFLIIRVSGSLI